jgi:hypothetical protein
MFNRLVQRNITTQYTVAVALLVTLALPAFAATNVYFNKPDDEALSTRSEFPYLAPKDVDKFYGKLPRLYLHGMWKLTVTPNPAGRNLGAGEYFLDDAGMKKGYTAKDFDDSKWDDFYVPQKVRLEPKNKYGISFSRYIPAGKNSSARPTGWESTPTLPPHDYADGYSYQSTRFVIPPERRGMRVVLHLDAANSLGVIFVNGHEAGRLRDYAAAGFVDVASLDITPWVNQTGDNRLVVRTYNQFVDGHWVAKSNGFNCNGVWSPVWLEFWNDIRAEHMKISPRFPDAAEVECVLINPKGQVEKKNVSLMVKPWQGVCSRMVDDKNKNWESKAVEVSLAPGENSLKTKIELPGIKPWHMDSPYLYEMQILVDGKLAGTDSFGVRSIKRDGRKILINNIPAYFFGYGLSDVPVITYLQGIRVNKNGILAAVLKTFQESTDINAVLRAGCMPEIFYQICDELGLARWDETMFVGGEYVFYEQFSRSGSSKFMLPIRRITPYFPMWTNYYKQLFDLYGNHPAIIAWSTDTEIHFNPRDEIVFQIDTINKYKNDDRLVCGEGIHFMHTTDTKTGARQYNMWKNEPKNSIPGMDFTQYHNRPMQYLDGRSLGWEIEQMHQIEQESVKAYPAAGGLPMTACPALILDYAQLMGLYLPRTTEELQKMWPNNKAEYLAAQAIWKNGRYDKTFLCDYLSRPDTLITAGFPQGRIVMGLVGVHTYMSNDDDRYKYMGFEMQRLGELFRWSNEFFKGYGFGNESHIAWTKDLLFNRNLDPAQIGPQPTLCAYTKRMQQRRLPVLDWHLWHNLFAGENHQYELRVMNDGITAFDGGKVTAKLLAGDAFDNFGKENTLPVVWTGETTIPEITVGERFSGKLDVNIPAGLASGRYTMSLFLSGNNGKSVSSNSYPFNIGSRNNVKLNCAGTIGVYCGDNNPAGIAFTAILENMGLKIEQLKDFSNINAYKMVIICPGAFDVNLEKQAETLHTWLAKGGRLLCMEQKAIGKVPFLNQMWLEAADKNSSEPVEPSHPAFAGLERNKDMDTLNGNNGSAYTHILMPASESVIALAWNHVGNDDYGKSRVAMAVSEVREGNGVCLLSQLLVSSRYDSDPQARRFVQQLVAYFVSSEMGKFARPARGKHKVRVHVDESRVFFVDLSKHANRGFVDEVAADGKGGWDDGGPQNDMRALKTGKQRLAGVPFDIINPAGNNGRGCIVLSGGILIWAPAAASGIPVNQKTKAFNFLHAYGYGKEGETCAKYIIKYDDGSIVEIPLICGKNIDSWWGSRKLDDAEVAWSGKNPAAGTISVYSYRWQNPHPDKKVAAIDFVSMNTGNTIPILVAITGENLL